MADDVRTVTQFITELDFRGQGGAGSTGGTITISPDGTGKDTTTLTVRGIGKDDPNPVDPCQYSLWVNAITQAYCLGRQITLTIGKFNEGLPAILSITI